MLKLLVIKNTNSGEVYFTAIRKTYYGDYKETGLGNNHIRFNNGKLNFKKLNVDNWYVAENIPVFMEYHEKREEVIVGYVLKDEFRDKINMPDEVNPDFFCCYDEDGEDIEERSNGEFYDFYKPKCEKTEDKWVPIEMEIDLIEDDLKPQDNKYPFVSKFPYNIKYLHSLSHIFPCYIEPDVLFTILKNKILLNLPDNCKVEYQGTDHLRISMELPIIHEENITNTTLKGKTIVSPLRSKTFELINIATKSARMNHSNTVNSISANNYKELEEKIDKEIQYYLDKIKTASVVVCPHCKGYGYISE